MRLTFSSRHLSIEAFPAIELPQFSVILGLNGAGKSHLLQAIKNGSVTNDVAAVQNSPEPAHAGEIALLHGQEPTAELPPYTSPEQQQPTAPPQPLEANFTHVRSTLLSEFRTRLDELIGDAASRELGATDVWHMGAEEFTRRIERPDLAEQICQIFAAAEASFTNPGEFPPRHPLTKGRAPHFISEAPRIARKLGISPLAITETHIRQFGGWNTGPIFQSNMANLFGRYRDAMLRNRLMQIEDNHTGSNLSLTDEEFEASFGRAPWLQLNETLVAFRLPYVVLPPELFSYSQVPFSIARVDGPLVRFHDLSSGEKVLLRFALSSFVYDEDQVSVIRPKLLLLDEMDSSLHPELVHLWLGAISNGLVGEQGMHCILTTHSPTTVALAPEEALYEMRDGFTGLTKISKQEALNRLTFGVPTLSIDYSGQRQVFAESDTDAGIYQRVYSIIKSSIDCARELNFLSTGMRTKDGGEINSGCTIVTNIVQSLHAAGNRAVYGIVDWDGSAVSTDRVKVIAEGVRDGIESVLLDPLLVCLLLMKIRRAPAGLDEIDRFVGADTLAAKDLQRMVDAVQHATFPEAQDTVEVTYLAGAKSNVLSDYLTTNDHDLEAALVTAFPALNKWSSRGRGELVKAVTEEVLTEHRGFCPIELKTVFETIANAPA